MGCWSKRLPELTGDTVRMTPWGATTIVAIVGGSLSAQMRVRIGKAPDQP